MAALVFVSDNPAAWTAAGFAVTETAYGPAAVFANGAVVLGAAGPPRMVLGSDASKLEAPQHPNGAGRLSRIGVHVRSGVDVAAAAAELSALHGLAPVAAAPGVVSVGSRSMTFLRHPESNTIVELLSGRAGDVPGGVSTALWGLIITMADMPRALSIATNAGLLAAPARPLKQDVSRPDRASDPKFIATLRAEDMFALKLALVGKMTGPAGTRGGLGSKL
nr:hypothetical protein HK105_003638 [Polyrhizophydium stewartii]